MENFFDNAYIRVSSGSSSIFSEKFYFAIFSFELINLFLS